MRLEVLLLADRRTNETLGDLAALEGFADVAVQLWVAERDLEQVDRFVARLEGDPRYQLFAHPALLRGDRLLHAAHQARGDLLLELPIGARLDARAVAEIARLPGTTEAVVGPEASIDGPIAVAPSALHARATLARFDALEPAVALAAQAADSLAVLEVPLLERRGATAAPEAEGAARVSVRTALLAEARLAGDDAAVRALQLELAGAVREWTRTRNAELLAGRLPVWRAADR